MCLIWSPSKHYVYILVFLSLTHLVGLQSKSANLAETCIGLTLQFERLSGFCSFYVSSMKLLRAASIKTVSHLLTFKSPMPNKLPGTDKVLFSTTIFGINDHRKIFTTLGDVENMNIELSFEGSTLEPDQLFQSLPWVPSIPPSLLPQSSKQESPEKENITSLLLFNKTINSHNTNKDFYLTMKMIHGYQRQFELFFVYW